MEPDAVAEASLLDLERGRRDLDPGAEDAVVGGSRSLPPTGELMGVTRTRLPGAIPSRPGSDV